MGRCFFYGINFSIGINFLKVHTNNKQLEVVSDYFKKSNSIKIEVEPIIRMGDLIETRDAKLIKIIKD